MTNEEQARYCNGDEAAHWLVHQERDERMLAPFTGRLLTAAASGRADRVVDIWNFLLRDADPPTLARVSGAVQAALEPYVMPDGLLLGPRAWLVTASRPWQ